MAQPNLLIDQGYGLVRRLGKDFLEVADEGIARNGRWKASKDTLAAKSARRAHIGVLLTPTASVSTYCKTINRDRTIAVDTQVERYGGMRRQKNPITIPHHQIPSTKSKRTAALLSLV
jgi:hypothetical protein